MSLYKRCKAQVDQQFCATFDEESEQNSLGDFLTPQIVSFTWNFISAKFIDFYNRYLPLFQLHAYRRQHFAGSVDEDFADEGYIDTWCTSDLLSERLEEKLGNVYARYFHTNP